MCRDEREMETCGNCWGTGEADCPMDMGVPARMSVRPAVARKRFCAAIVMARVSKKFIEGDSYGYSRKLGRWSG